MRQLRPYQVDTIQAIRDTIRNGVKKMVVQLPTGGGKTLLAAKIAEGILSKGNRMAFTTPRIDLCDQTMREFYKEGIEDVGIIQADHFMTDHSRAIQICSVQSLESKEVYPDVPLVFFDEIHMFRNGHDEYMKRYPNTVFIGLSATPWRKGLADKFDTLIVGATMKELMKLGFLTQYRVFTPNTPDLKGIKITGGDYNEGQLSERLRSNSKLTADIVDSWKRLHGTDRTLLFATDRAHAKALQERFEQAGIRTGYQDALTPRMEREEWNRKFHAKEIQVMISVETMIIGHDWDVRCISWCRPSLSEMFFAQGFGRGMRPAPPGSDPKEHLTFLDHSGTFEKLGRPEDIEFDGLLSTCDNLKEKKKKMEEMEYSKQCSKCSFMKPPRTSLCPNCGFKPEIVSEIFEKDGELQELIAGQKQKLLAPKLPSLAEKGQFLAELRAYAKDKEKTEKWVMAMYKSKWNEWPQWSIKDISAAPFPSAKTVQYVKYRNIRFAKSKANQKAKQNV